jgi:hypothetical protein
MGKRDRMRRRREKASTRPESLSVRETIFAALGARRQPLVYRELLTALVAEGFRLEAELDVVIDEAVRTARGRNWHAADAVRQAERRLGPAEARYLDDVWRGGERVPATTVPVLACAIEVLALLLSLPVLPKLSAAPSRARSGEDPKMLERVRALLAKAESTTFPEEAEALSAKAQELMTRHAIDDAMVGGVEGVDDIPGGLRLPVDDPYARAKSILLAEVASANRCSAVWSESLGFSTVFGFESDLEFVEVLYTSLLVQATSAMVAAGSQVDVYGRSRTRSFRHAFLLAYATRVGSRLREAEAASTAAAAAEYGEALLPVLADRSAAVDAARDAAFPGAVKRPVSVTNAAGWAAGKAAADLASLSGRTEVPASG